jgi:hypothetical protein
MHSRGENSTGVTLVPLLAHKYGPHFSTFSHTLSFLKNFILNKFIEYDKKLKVINSVK